MTISAALDRPSLFSAMSLNSKLSDKFDDPHFHDFFPAKFKFSPKNGKSKCDKKITGTTNMTISRFFFARNIFLK